MRYRLFDKLATKDELWTLWFLHLKSRQATEFELREKFSARFNILAERIFKKAAEQRSFAGSFKL